jgi:hypothetical protein
LKVVFAVPSLAGPTAPFLDALEESIPLVVQAGWEEGVVEERGNPYISSARSIMTRKALDAHADVIVYLDYDLSWSPRDLLALLETPGDVVAGTYRFKMEEERYMGAVLSGPRGTPLVRDDGCIQADRVPAGFLKVTRKALEHFARAYPHLLYGDKLNPSLDLFNHGAHEGVWYGEDYSFSRRWVECGGQIWIRPELNLTHWAGKTPFPGNFHEFLLRCDGGLKSANPRALEPA